LVALISTPPSGGFSLAQVAKLRVDTRRWLASKQAPDEYGDKQQPLVNIDLGSMALDALRKRSIVSVDSSE